MQARPLPHKFPDGAGIRQLIGRRPRPLIGRHIADAVARCLDGMHLDTGKGVEDVGRVLEFDPVELDVLPCGEVAVAAIPFLGDQSEGVELAR